MTRDEKRAEVVQKVEAGDAPLPIQLAAKALRHAVHDGRTDELYAAALVLSDVVDEEVGLPRSLRAAHRRIERLKVESQARIDELSRQILEVTAKLDACERERRA